MTGKRVRFSCLGVTDIVSFDPNQTNQLAVTNHFQQVRLLMAHPVISPLFTFITLSGGFNVTGEISVGPGLS